MKINGKLLQFVCGMCVCVLQVCVCVCYSYLTVCVCAIAIYLRLCVCAISDKFLFAFFGSFLCRSRCYRSYLPLQRLNSAASGQHSWRVYVRLCVCVCVSLSPLWLD